MLRNLRITHFLIILALVPMAAALWFSGQSILKDRQQTQSMAQLSDLVSLSIRMSDLVHELQKERGASAGFLSSKGAMFGPELAEQRKLTDERRRVLENFAKTIDRESTDPQMVANLDRALAKLTEMPQVRASADSLNASIKEVIGYYTGLNGQFLNLISGLALISDDPAISVATVAYASFLQSKERAGIERAVGSAGFAAKRFSRDDLARFANLIERQATYADVFLTYATQAQKTAYHDLLNGEAATSVQTMRDYAFEQGALRDVSNVDAKNWFSTITQKINGLKAIETQLADDLRTTMAEVQAAASNRLMMTSLIALAALMTATALSGFVIWTIRHNFAAILAPMRAMSKGDLEQTLPVCGNNEFGAMVDALDIFRTNALEMRRLEAEKRAQAEREAETAARHAASMNALRESMDTTVRAAINGDFSHRVTTEIDEAELRELAQMMNELMVEVDSGLRETIHSLEALAKADLTVRMTGDFRGAFAQLQQCFDASVTNLSQLVTAIDGTVGEVLVRVGDISAGAADLSARTESQAASLEETAATMEELSSTVQSNAAALDAAESVSAAAQDRASNGSIVVERAVDAVSRIEKSAARIAEINTVIDSIAFQTNLLALNAAVEAARAGEAGKGFAVVAAEVRTLAQRSSEAARDIAGLIRESTENVSSGVQLVGETGEALTAIGESISDMSGQIVNVTSAGREQAIALNEINSAVTELDSITQQNAVLSDETVNATRGLSAEIDRLKELVAAFHLSGSHINQSTPAIGFKGDGLEEWMSGT